MKKLLLDSGDPSRKGKNFDKPAPDATSGMSIVVHDGRKVVVSVKPNGPAARAGIQRGDQFVTVSGKDVKTIDMFELRKILTHGPSKTVVLQVHRNGVAHAVTIELDALQSR